MLGALDLIEQHRGHFGETSLLGHSLGATLDPGANEEWGATEALGGCGFPLHVATMTSAGNTGNVLAATAVKQAWTIVLGGEAMGGTPPRRTGAIMGYAHPSAHTHTRSSGPNSRQHLNPNTETATIESPSGHVKLGENDGRAATARVRAPAHSSC